MVSEEQLAEIRKTLEKNYSMIKGSFMTIPLKGAGANVKGPAMGNPTMGKILKEDDGELNKRITKQENDAAGLEDYKDDDSKEDALRKLHDLYKLEVITPADMVEKLFPSQAQQLRQKILTVSAKEKDLGLPEFPSKLCYALRKQPELAEEYKSWVHDQNIRERRSYVEQHIKNFNSRALGNDRPDQDASVGYMLDYNRQVSGKAAVHHTRYWGETLKEASAFVMKIGRIYMPTYVAIDTQYEKEMEAVKGDTHEDQVKKAEIELKHKRAINATTDALVMEVIPQLDKYYTGCKKETERIWEQMLPYTRCTVHPEYEIATLFYALVPIVLDLLQFFIEYAKGASGRYYRDVSYGDLLGAEAIAEAMRSQVKNSVGSLEGFTISVSLGVFEFKLMSNKVKLDKVEFEYANTNYRVAFNWKAKQAEFGVGGGYKAQVNFMLDVRNNTITEVYLNGEAKGSMSGFESGGQLQLSSKQAIVSFRVKHKTNLIGN
jgi:hypothetical protein